MGKGTWSGWLCLVLLAGCASHRPHVDQALLSTQAVPSHRKDVDDQYVASCPDVLDVRIEGRPDIVPGRRRVGPDGRIDLGPLGRVTVEALSLTAIRAKVAQAARTSPEAVHVYIGEYNSQQVFIFGAVNGLQRAVPYRGPETVLDLLQRVGGITPGAEPLQVYVIRSHVPENQRPEVFPVDLQAIVMKKDQRTNLSLEPFDQIYIGETRQSAYMKCVPPCLRPLYQAMCGLQQVGGAPGRGPNSTSPLMKDSLASR
ncbi:MAG: hypothetical protein K2R98_01325 [Gemmataceae bacterium]|nr:hypothetical protein [Gemmataceae bacterium]